MKAIYEFSSYKQYLKNEIEKLGSGGVGQLATAAGCNRSYLSQVLSLKANLTTDHVYNLSSFLNLTEAEESFFFLLLNYERSADANVRQKLLKKINEMQKENMQLSKTIKQVDKNISHVDDVISVHYFGEWKNLLIHLLASAPGGVTLNELCEVMRLPANEIESCLQFLARNGFVEKKGSRYFHNMRNLHIEKKHPANRVNHLNWRMKAVEKCFDNGGVHYTHVFSVSREHVMSLKAEVIEFIDRQRKKIAASGSDEVLCFCCDFFSPVRDL